MFAVCLAGLQAGALAPAHAFTVSISPGTKALFLQVGAGTMTGGNFNAGGVPGNNSTINTATVTVPAAQLGSGVAQPMATNSTVSVSPWDGYSFCSTPATTGLIYVGGFYRLPGSSGASATLAVTTPANLTNAAGNTIPFNRISWTSSGNGDATTTIPSGQFTGAAQTLLSVPLNTWFESCLAFSYLNTKVVPAGSFTGQATFTLTAP